MDGWCSVEDLTRWAFSRSPVVMANEAHHGLTRCPRTRRVGQRMVRAAHELGVRRLAMEALPWLPDGSPGPAPGLPPASEGYLGQPEMRDLISTAQDLGWTLWAYEIRIGPDDDPTTFTSMEFTNRREAEQAGHLADLQRAAAGEPLLVWCGNSHATKEPIGDWTPMGYHFIARTGIDPFVIDQTPTVDWPEITRPTWLAQRLEELAGTLARYDGTMGILRDQAPAPWNEQTGVDALIVSTDNEML